MDAKLTIDDKKKVAIIEIPLNDSPRTSTTGATVSVAETRNQQTNVVLQGKALKVTCQVYYKP